MLRAALIAFVVSMLAASNVAAQVDTVSTLNLLSSYNGVSTVVNVQAYATLGDGGGGTFVSTSAVACVDISAGDGGVSVYDSMKHVCWYRQFSGPVNLQWYGVKDATSGPCLSSMSTCDASTSLKNAFVAAAVGKFGVVRVKLSSDCAVKVADGTCDQVIAALR